MLLPHRVQFNISESFRENALILPSTANEN